MALGLRPQVLRWLGYGGKFLFPVEREVIRRTEQQGDSLIRVQIFDNPAEHENFRWRISARIEQHEIVLARHE